MPRTVEQKLAIVGEVSESGDPVAPVARRHDMNANHLFRWIQQAQEDALGGRRSSSAEPQRMDFIDLGFVWDRPSRGAPMIEIQLPSGVRVPAWVRPAPREQGRRQMTAL
jgi:transposase